MRFAMSGDWAEKVVIVESGGKSLCALHTRYFCRCCLFVVVRCMRRAIALVSARKTILRGTVLATAPLCTVLMYTVAIVLP
jgi:hypothetical protein